MVHDFVHRGSPARLDVVLCERVSGYSRAFLQRLIEDGCVTLKPVPRQVKPSLRVADGTNVRLVIPPPRQIDLSPQDIPIDLLYEDAFLAVIDKPAGLTVHPAPHAVTGTLVNALLFKLKDLSSVGGEERPGIVHRLDKETSGVLVVAKCDSAHRHLSAQFKARSIHKTYIAIVRGEPSEDEGHVNLPLGRSYTHSKKQMVRVDGTGREATTDYQVLERYRGYALLEVRPHTGRTHQIRVHLAHLSTPVACDKLYGRERTIYLSSLRAQARPAGETPLMARQALHATTLSFHHPHTGETMSFTSPLKGDLRDLLNALNQYRAFR